MTPSLRRAWWAGVALCAGLGACAAPAPVLQGKVVAVEADATRLVVADETRPEADPLALDVSGAEIGTAPVVGDVVRVVYRAEAGGNRAIAVMNVSRQRESGSSGGH